MALSMDVCLRVEEDADVVECEERCVIYPSSTSSAYWLSDAEGADVKDVVEDERVPEEEDEGGRLNFFFIPSAVRKRLA